MKISDRMHYAGIVNSQRFAKLSWFQRDFFRNLIHAADGHGRFEAEPALLRMVLYGLLAHKVSVRDVQEALMRCAAAEIGLVKLYVVGGRGYGKIVNYRQTLTKRNALYPEDPDDGSPPPEPELFTEPVSVLSAASERKKEEKSPQSPPAGGGTSFRSGSESAGPRAIRRRRSPEKTLAMAREELAEVEIEMGAILRPGGCAYNVTPVGEKAERFKKLEEQRAQLKQIVGSARKAVAEEIGDD